MEESLDSSSNAVVRAAKPQPVMETLSDKNAIRVKADLKVKLKWKLKPITMDKTICKFPYPYDKSSDPRCKSTKGNERYGHKFYFAVA